MNYILYGEEEYLIKKRIKELQTSLIVNDEYASVFYNALQTPIIDIIDDANMLPMFCENKIIVVENAHYFMASKKNKEKNADNHKKNDENDLLLSYLKAGNASSTIIFVCNGNLDSKKKVVKEALKLCQCECFNRLESKELRAYIKNYFAKNKVKCDDKLLDYITNLLPQDLQKVNMELQKLAVYPLALDYETINKLITRPLEDNVFNLSNAILNHDITNAIVIWRDFMKLNMEPLMIIATFASQLRFCYQVAYLKSLGYTNDEIAIELKCKSGRVYNTNKLIKNQSAKVFLDLLEKLSEVDLKIKSGSVDKKVAFENFLINMR